MRVPLAEAVRQQIHHGADPAFNKGNGRTFFRAFDRMIRARRQRAA